MANNNTILVEAKDLVKHYPVGTGWSASGKKLTAVDGVNLTIHRGETLGLVGESGCGKSTLGRLLLHLIEPTTGQVYFDGKNLSGLKARTLRRMRKQMQIIFQDPTSSLNPRMSIDSMLNEVLAVHQVVPKSQREERVAELLELVNLSPDSRNRYPHEFSTGQRQRIAIARALAVEPTFIVCDEPVTALDVSIQAQIINLLNRLQQEFSLTYLFIAHDLRVVEYISDLVAVMYLGKIVEQGTRDQVFENPLHPYTKALMSAIPEITSHSELKQRTVLKGDVPSPAKIPSGCRFHTRCPVARYDCAQRILSLEQLEPGHQVSCYYAKEDNAIPILQEQE